MACFQIGTGRVVVHRAFNECIVIKRLMNGRQFVVTEFIENREETRVLNTGGIAARNMVIYVYARVDF